MRLGRCFAINFGSYSTLEIDFSSPGLSLIYGPTGSGKSTLPDLACWCLFGVTAKNGVADDVRAWQTPDEPTTVILDVITKDGLIQVTRVRGKAAQNDLYWTVRDEEPIRGKDIKDTQKLLNERLGVDAALYTTAAYFSEFSPSAHFFLANSKDRRAILERIAKLDLPAKLSSAASEQRKITKSDLEKAEKALSKTEGQIEYIQLAILRAGRDAVEWTKAQAAKIIRIQSQFDSFESDKDAAVIHKVNEVAELEKQIKPFEDYIHELDVVATRIKNLTQEKCTECGALRQNEKKQYLEDKKSKLLVENLKNNQKIKDYEKVIKELDALDKSKNHYAAQLAAEKNLSNPFVDVSERNEKERQAATIVRDIQDSQVTMLKERVSNLSQLYDLSFNLRGELLSNAVHEVESATNNYLEKHFDSEIKVSFTLDADSLEVSIQKSGYECSYSQLSKGQRGLLKLCFVLSVMAAASNKAGVHFENLFLDEALDGLDSELKVKAFGLLEELASVHTSVYVIDHAPEFQILFSTKLKVYLDGDNSVVEYE